MRRSDEYQAALRINPDYAEAHYNLGVVYGQQGRIDEAIREYQAALRINPDYAEAHHNLGLVYGQQGRTDEAIREYQAALRINPDYAEAHYNLGVVYGATGPHRRGDPGVSGSAADQPRLAEAHYSLGVAYETTGPLSTRRFVSTRRRCGSTPTLPKRTTIWAWSTGNRAASTRRSGRTRRRCGSTPTCRSALQPGRGLRQQGRIEEAIREYQAALRINPDYAEAHHDLGVAYGQQGRIEEAIHEYQAALRINPKLCRRALQPGRGLQATRPFDGSSARSPTGASNSALSRHGSSWQV